MSNDTIITVQNLGKKYALSHQPKERYTALRDVLTDRARSLFRRNGDAQPAKEDFWALKDVSFEMKQGEVIGIIGRNGAGKSTLLKILSRITEPTTGQVRIKGRVASLLEVGTGFHPELTGRENIFLNGAVLGMTRAEIKKKFDEIVAFAEIEKFLDTPVKRYSSGMYVRLAFAVAAHLEPEILIVDEVLAVGDAEFQRKCLGKMDQAAKGGRTVIFVSHNLAQVRRLAMRGLLLNQGTLLLDCPTDKAVQAYLQQGADGGSMSVDCEVLESKSHGVRLSGFDLKGLNGEDYLRTGRPCRISMEAFFEKPMNNPGFIVSLRSREGSELLRLSTSPVSGVDTGLCVGKVECMVELEELQFAGGLYHLAVGLSIPNVDYIIPISEVGRFTVEPTDYYNSGFSIEDRFGLMVARHRWEVRHLA